MSQIRLTLATVARVIRAVLGVPDYERYVAHRQAFHAGCPLLTRDEFARERSESRYNKPGSRCC